MRCPKCQMENLDGVQLCRCCSWVLTSTSITSQNPDARISKLAITSLVLAVLSFFTFFLTMIPAMIFGIVSIFKIEKSGGRLKGKGLAIAGMAAPYALLPVIALLMGVLMPALARVRDIAHRMVCGENLAGLGRAMLVYSDDFGGKYPTASKWCDLLIEHTDANSTAFQCISVPEGPCNYAMNRNIEKLGAESPPDMVLLFETAVGWNQSGGPEILSTENHKGEGCNILFNDGYAAFVKTEDVNDLRWTAEQNE